MSSLVKSEFKKDLESLKEKVNEQNDGISTAKRISSGIVAIAQKSVTQANASKSIDEKINILVSGLQEAVSFSEKESADLKERVLKLRDKIEYLEIRNCKDMSKNINKNNFKIFIAYRQKKIRLIDNI